MARTFAVVTTYVRHGKLLVTYTYRPARTTEACAGRAPTEPPVLSHSQMSGSHDISIVGCWAPRRTRCCQVTCLARLRSRPPPAACVHSPAYRAE